MTSVKFEAAGAAFIGSPDRRLSGSGDPALYFRTEFDARTDLLSATLHLTALGTVEPYLNGVQVGDEILAPGWTSYRHRLLVRSHDVSTLVRPGRNAFGAIVGEGWALGRLGFESIARRRIFADRPAMLALIELRYPDRTEFVATGDRFRCGEGAVRENSLYDGVTIDARLEPAGWNEAGFDDHAWQEAEPVDWDMTTLAEATAPPIRRVEELPPLAIWRSPAGSTVVDFGQNLAGWVRLRLDGPRGTSVSVRHAEVLVDGVPDYTTLRTAEATDWYVLAGYGSQEFEPRFTYHGFRYAEIDGLHDELLPEDVGAVVVHSDMIRTGWFETSNHLLNRLHENVVWSMRGNFVGIPTDCPQRDERLGWTGDLNAFAPTATYLYDVREVLMSWLDDLALEQKDRGFVPYVVPDVQASHDTPTALWSDVAVRLPWQLYWEYGEEDILRHCYDSMAAFTRSVVPLLDPKGVWSSGFQFGDWLDPSAPMHDPQKAKTDRHLVATAFFHQTAREMASAANVLRRADDAAYFTDVADRVRAGFRAEYVSSNGRITSESATAYALAIQCGLIDEAQLPRAGARLAEIVRRDGHRISTGFAGTPHLAQALTATGHTDDAYRLLLETRMPSFLDPVVRGATTIWERWDAILPDGTVNPSGMTSLNHYALGAIANWMHSAIAGLRATSPGYRTMRIAPHVGGGLTHVSASHDTVHGRVGVEWVDADGTMTVRVAIPDGTTAVVELPRHPDRTTHSVGAGHHEWTYAPLPPSNRLTLDSTVDRLAADDSAFASVVRILRDHLPPHLHVEQLLDQSAGLPFSVLLGDLPGLPGHVRRELSTVIENKAESSPTQKGSLLPMTYSVQLYTVRDALAEDLPGTIRRLAEIGYRHVEPCDFADRTEEFAAAFADTGITAPTGHALLIPADATASIDVTSDTSTVQDKIFTAARRLGIGTVIHPLSPPEHWQDAETIRSTAARLNAAAEKGAEYGIRVGYHNHDWEISSKIDGVTALEFFAGLLDPELVLEVDTYWATVGGEDPARLLERLGERVIAIHIKDGLLSGGVEGQLPAGQGEIDVRGVVAAAKNLEVGVVEFDHYAGDIFDGVAGSLRYLQAGADAAAREAGGR